MYYSRQLALFDPKVAPQLKTKKSNLTLNNVLIHDIVQIQDYIETPVESTLNEFRRVRVNCVQEHISKSNQTIHVDYKMSYNRWVSDDQLVIIDNCRDGQQEPPADPSDVSVATTAHAFIGAGPRQFIPWKHGEVRAAIVTCGGLCPGLNNVVQEIFYSLYYNYGVDIVYGIRSGYRGFWQQDYQPWLRLTPEFVKDIHEQGGTCLGASRGGFDRTKIVNALEVYGINQVYIVGGDGTHRGAWEIQQECRERGLKVCVACVPKTIDNDIGIIDRSFGFNTSVAEARKAINSVVLEAQCTPNGIGIVKLMGRHAGYIATHASLACRQVDVCLIPEVPFQLHGENGLLQHLQRVLRSQKSAVVVVAEGAGADLLEAEAHSAAVDESGNKRLGDIGAFLTKHINRHFKQEDMQAQVKFVDPAYMIRSVPADAEDAVFCLFLASHAVHGAMAGYTGFSVGMVTGRTVYIPIDVIVKASPAYLNPKGSTWERVLAMTHQPNWGAPTKLFEPVRETVSAALNEVDPTGSSAAKL
jgi:6-phosphofructokinase 1